MPSGNHPLLKTPLRYCLSCGATLACWALWLLLGAGLGLQLSIVALREVPVPAFVLRRLETELAAANLSVQFGRARFEPSGRLLLEEVRLFARPLADPLLTSRMVLVRKRPWSLLTGRLTPDEIRLEGATLQLPALLSPSGTTEPLLRDFSVTVRRQHRTWEMVQCAGMVGPVRLLLQGHLTAGPPAGAPLSLNREQLLRRGLEAGQRLVLFLPQLQSLAQPTLSVHFAASPPGPVDVAFRLSTLSAKALGGRPLDLGACLITGGGQWSAKAPGSWRLAGTIARLDYDDRVTAEALRVEAELHPAADYSGLREAQVRLAAGTLRALGEQWDQPVGMATLTLPDQRLRAGVSFRNRGEALAFNARASLAQRTVELDYSGRVPPGLVTSLLTRYGPKLEPYFRFGDPVAVQGTVSVLPDWRFERLTAHVEGGRLDSSGVAVTRVRGRIAADARGDFHADDAQVVLGDNQARGSYFMNFRSRNYRMLLTGRLRPPAISGWFRSNWWPDFWRNFAFPTAPPEADVDVQGNWRNSTGMTFFGRVDAPTPVVLGADFARVRTRIFLRPTFTHVYALEATRANGTQELRGWFKRTADPVTRRVVALAFDGTGNPAPEVYAQLGGATAVGLLAPWRLTHPPRAHAWGRTDFPSAGPASNHLSFEAEAEGPLHYYDFPLDQLAVAGRLDGTELRLDRIRSQVAGGTAEAQATLNGPADARSLAFDATIKEADLARTIRTLEVFTAARAGTPTAPVTDSRFLKRAQGGKLDLVVSGRTDPAHLEALRGKGQVQITGAELAEIHLFGLLSQLLSAVWLNFTSLKLDQARSSFTIADGRVHFPDVKVSGPSAVIDARGDYLIAPKALDFTARLKPYEETRNPLTWIVGLVVNPLTSIFELKLSGPIAKPAWSFALGASGTGRPAPTTAAPSAPPAPSPTAAVAPAPQPPPPAPAR